MSITAPGPLSAEAFARSENVSRETLARLSLYLALLERWQKRINLVGGRTLEDPWRRHILDSAQLVGLIEGPVLIDLGSGAGLPGLILAILRPDLEVHLIESDARKCAFLREAARETAASATIHTTRVEAVAPFRADTVVARALAPLPQLLPLAARFTPRVCVFSKGEEVEQELTESRKDWKFDLERVPSRSDPRGVILRLREVEYVEPNLRHREPEGRGR
jgi:16S rRNA (guanine527-N7)-methyltransferase